jgi:uncharacterized membrane protein (Fun14 family)
MAVVGEYLLTFLDTVKRFWNEFDLKQWSEQIGGSSAEAIQAAVYFLMSFICGFILKKYFKFIFTCLLLSCLLIMLMEIAKFVLVDWVAIKAFFGMTEPTDFNALINHQIDWIKDHILISIATLIGFIVGYKLG